MFQMMNKNNMIQQFINFRNNFMGNPQAEVMKLVSQGKITQEQLNQLQTMAKEFNNILHQCK